MKRKSLLLAGLCGLMVMTSSCSSASPELTTEGVLVVGMECAYAPFNWTETEQTSSNVAIDNIPGAYAEGYDVQVAKIIAEELNLELKIKSLEWGALVNGLNSGTIDAIIAGMSPTETRKKKIDFTSSYYESTHVMLVEADSIYANATSLDDFAGAVVIGQTGTIYADLVSQAVEHGAVAGTNLKSVPLCINEILNGNTDATILEEPVAKGIVSQYPGQLTYVKLTDGGFTVSDEDRIVSIGVRKNFVLLDEINNILDTVITNDVRNELMDSAVLNAPTQSAEE